MKIAIDISRSASGGGLSHITNFVRQLKDSAGKNEYFIFGPTFMLDQIPDHENVKKLSDVYLNGSLLSKIFWQLFVFPKQIERLKIDKVLYTSGTVLRLTGPAVVMCRDMLAFDKNAYNLYSVFSYEYWRLFALRKIRRYAFKNADAVIFLNKYVADYINNNVAEVKKYEIIPHGIGKQFLTEKNSNVINSSGTIKCVYVSNLALYKHQWNVARSIHELRKSGYNVEIDFIGSINKGKAKDMFESVRTELDPEKKFIRHRHFVKNMDLAVELTKYEIFIFASSCENLPNTLLEGMAMGMPIACSRVEPMISILQDGGSYFDPFDVKSISEAIQRIIDDKEYAFYIRSKAQEISTHYSWKDNVEKTLNLLSRI